MTPIISDPSDTKGWANAASQHRATDEPSPVSRSRPFGSVSAFAAVIDHLLAIKSPDVEWLERAGPIARRLNEDAKHD